MNDYFTSSKEDWLMKRKNGIGGSDAAAILGLNRWKSPIEVYYEKIAEDPIDKPETAIMTFGHMAEDIIAGWWEKETGRKLARDAKPGEYHMRFHPEYDWIFCDLDRVILPDQEFDTPGVFEAKSTTSYYIKTWTTEIPLEYFAQVQHNLFATTWIHGALGILIVDQRDFDQKPLLPDENYQKLMFDELKRFWFDNVLEQVPPEPKTEQDLSILYPKSDPEKTIEATETEYNQVEAIKELKAQKKEVEAQLESLIEEVKLHMKDAEFLMYDEKVIATWKSAADSKYFDAKGFKEANPILYEEFVKTKAGSRKFLPKK